MGVDADGVVVLPQGSERPLRALAVLLRLAVLHELLGVLVDAEVGEVDEALADVLGLDVVLVGGEAGESFLEHVDAQGIVAGDQDVDAEVVLEVVYQVRVADVLGHQDVFLVLYGGLLGHHLYAAPAGLVGRLHYPQLVLLGGLPGHLEALEVGREEVGVGHEVISLGEASPLLVQILPHVVLPSQAPAAWKVVDLLKLVHVLERPQMGAADIEVDVPLAALLHLQEAVELQGVDDAFVL